MVSTRAELDAEWELFFSDIVTGTWQLSANLKGEMQRLLAAERAYVDRAGQAATIRWAAKEFSSSYRFPDGPPYLVELANRVEAGEVAVEISR